MGESLHEIGDQSAALGVGLAPASQIERLGGDVRRAEARVAHLERELEQLRAEGQSWKRRHDDTSEAMAGWKQAAHRAQAEAEHAKAGADGPRRISNGRGPMSSASRRARQTPGGALNI